MIDGSLLSRSIFFTNKPYHSVKIKPEKVQTIPGSVARFVCYWLITSSSSPTATDIIWKHNGTTLKPSKLIKIGTIPGKSVLHILSTKFEHSGNYRCGFKNSKSAEEESDASELIVNESGGENDFSQGYEQPSALSAPINGKMIFECLLPGTQGVRWILEKRSYEKRGEALPRIESKVLGNGTILILQNITTKYHGIIKCLIEVSNNTLVTKETDFKVLDETYNYESAVFTSIERKQGIPASFRCETYEILGETPEMAEWYLNGKQIERTPNIKIIRSIDFGLGHTDLAIAIAEAENEGLYTCIISNDQHERIHQLLLQVDVTTNETITNLKVSTDHKTSCIQLDFDLPPSTDLAWAHYTPFFVVIHENNSTESLNSLPLMAKCNKRLHCKMEICQTSQTLNPATEYVFRISMVLSGAGTIITPLSEPVIATTWDSQATKSVPLIVSCNETDKSITIEWEMPKDINGKVENFAVQIINYSEKMSNLFTNLNRSYFERPPTNRKYTIQNVTDPFAYKIRVTPFTQKPKLPVSKMPLLEYFPFFLITSDHALASVDPEISIPKFELFQINRDPTINISWTLPSENENISKIVIKYQHVAISQAKFISIERPISDKFTELNKGIEVGLVFQVCAAFIRKTDFSQSSWNCQTIPVKNVFNNLIYTTLNDAWSQKQLPPPVLCENDNCKCMPSKINEGGMRIEWKAPEQRKTLELDDFPQNPEIQYIVHYTFDENDPHAKEFEFPANEGDLFAEIPPLLPNTTYRIMIESINQLNDKVDGTFFSCKTPTTSPLPPPKNFYYEFLNSTHLKLTWIPYSSSNEQIPQLSGYTIFWQADNKPFLPIFIPVTYFYS
uniref:Uncharacterized protein n=1 Tax=Panagrolaimus davidi TaxID=227884 RepID=A0A914QPN9_9BILA